MNELVVALVAGVTWAGAVLATWRATDPERRTAGPVRPPAEPPAPSDSVTAVVAAVARARTPDELEAETVRGALATLHRRELIVVVDDGTGHVAVRSSAVPAPGDLLESERLTLQRITALEGRARGDVPLDALRPYRVDRWTWAAGVARAATREARRLRLVRRRVARWWRALLTLWGAVAPLLLTWNLFRDPTDQYRDPLDLAGILAAGILFTVWALRRSLRWADRWVLSAPGLQALERAPAEPPAPGLGPAPMPVGQPATSVASWASGRWRTLTVPPAPTRHLAQPVAGRVVGAVGTDSGDAGPDLLVDVGEAAVQRVTVRSLAPFDLGDRVRIAAGRGGTPVVTHLGAPSEVDRTSGTPA